MQKSKRLRLVVLLAVGGLISCAKAPSPSQSSATNATAPSKDTAQAVGSPTATLQPVTKNRPDPSAIQLSDITIEEYQVNATDGDYYAPSVRFTLSAPPPDYYTYKACNTETKSCFTGQFFEPSVYLCGFDPGTYAFSDFQGCTETDVDGKPGTCSPAFNTQNGLFMVKPTTSPTLAKLMQVHCQNMEAMKTATASLFTNLANPKKTPGACIDGFSQILDYGSISYAGMLYLYAAMPQVADETNASNLETSSDTDTSTDTSVASNKPSASALRAQAKLKAGEAGALMGLGAGLIVLGINALWNLKHPYKERTYDIEKGGKRVLASKEVLTKDEFNKKWLEAKAKSPGSAAGEVEKRMFFEKTKYTAADAQKLSEFQNKVGDRSIEHMDGEAKVKVTEGIDNVNLRRAGAVAAMFAGAGLIAVSVAMSTGHLGLADTSSSSSGASSSSSNATVPPSDARASQVSLAPIMACLQDPDTSDNMNQILTLLKSRDATNEAVNAALAPMQPK